MVGDPEAGRATQETIAEDALEAFAERFRGEVVRPDDGEYDSARQVWNGTIDKYPAIIARCAGTADVVAAVEFAREEDLRVAVRGGGHNVAGTGVCDGGIVIDLSAMRGVHVDLDAGTVRAQGGATWGDVDSETQVFGQMTPGGAISSTGIAGLTLGGGYGWTRRTHGLTCDNLVSADVVTADGNVVTASEDQHSDLFWALRGGGGNFGVVTSFEFDLYELGPEILFLGAMYPLDDAPTVLSEWVDYMETAPDELTADADVWTIPETPMFPEELHGTPFVGILGTYAGDFEEGEGVVEPLRTITKPLLDMTGPMDYLQLQSMLDPFFPKGARYYWKSRYLTDLNEDAIETIVEYGRKRPSGQSVIPIRSRGGAVTRVGSDETAFPDRSSPFMLSIDGAWEDSSEDDENVEWVREFWEAMEPYAAEQGYQNFSMLDEADETAATMYGDNYDRLVTVKDEYDPKNVFQSNANVRPSD
ncbi:FAD-binding oxidoreductase [Halorussus halophilus]|uniref:FAD-binding oxidoreductase n=1 Tax=Halorussus halophilus TaxID=2650975 RepID=UPI0013013365|nr:FAD-binding oxidoreductase [Halorussus halophilus]